jgi:ABC-type branched-subunit amino acid transport system ATPase component
MPCATPSGSVERVIEVNRLTKRYGGVTAVNGLTFTVSEARPSTGRRDV